MKRKKTENAGLLERVVRPLLSYANETPELLSLLYDMDLMPEQLKEKTQDWDRMLTLIYAWKNRRWRPTTKLSHSLKTDEHQKAT